MLHVLAAAAVIGFPSAGESGPVSAPPAPVRVYMTAERLEGYCRDSDPASGRLEACLGYLAGAVDQLLVVDALSPRPELCPPADLNLGVLYEAFLARVRAHPEERAMPGALVAAAAAAPVLSCIQLVNRREKDR